MSDRTAFAIEDEVFQVNLVRWAQKKRISFGVAVRRAGRIAAMNFAKHTQPFGFDQSARALGESAVERDIRRVYAPDWLVFKRMKTKDEGLADAFWYFFHLPNRRRSQQLVDASGLFPGVNIEPFNPALHAQLRNRRGRVPKSQHIASIPSNTKKIAQHIAKKQRMVGFVKAGYAVAARELGGTRGIPQWVTRHRNAPGMVIDAAESINDPHVIIRNGVDYASQCINETAKQGALDDTRDNLIKFLRLQLGEDDFSTSTVFNPAY